MRAEWLRCSLVLEGVEVENPLRCRLSMDMFMRLDIGNWYVSFSFQGLSLLNVNDTSAYFLPLFHGYHGYPMLRNILAIIKRLMYHHLPGLCSKTMVYSKISKKLWVPGMVWMFFF